MTGGQHYHLAELHLNWAVTTGEEHEAPNGLPGVSEWHQLQGIGHAILALASGAGVIPQALLEEATGT